MISNDLKEWTVSNIFLVPILKIGRNRLATVGFINSFLYNDEEDILYDNAIHLLFLPQSLDLFNMFIDEERERNSTIVDEHDYPGGYIIVTYILPSKFEKDYAKLWEGDYSGLSNEFKNAIPKEIKYTKANGITAVDMSVQHMVFTKHEPLRKFWEKEFNVIMDNSYELWAKPTRKLETFKLENYDRVATNLSKASG
jgi:hypothetical protein